MIPSKESKVNVRWQESNIMDSFALIFRPNPSIVLNTDSSLAGLGSSMAGSKTGTFLIGGITAAYKCFRTQSYIIWINSLV